MIVAALLNAVVITHWEKPTVSEAILEFPPQPQPEKAAPKAASGAAAASGTFQGPAPIFQTPNFSPQALGLGQAVFGCQPEKWQDLSREQQEKCAKLSGGRFVAMKDGVPVDLKLKGPEWEGLRNSDLRARERNTSDPCQAAKATGTECIHDIIYGKGLW
ncbi:hypothetical protein GCM10008941_33330 [Rhizomicrobium palustre]